MPANVTLNKKRWSPPAEVGMVYLAGGIDYCDPEFSTGWRGAARAYLALANISCYDPAAAFSYAGAGHDAIVAVNESALAHCDLALFELSGRSMSVGTPVELYRAAAEMGKATVVWTLPDPPVYIRHYAGAYCSELVAACRFIAELKQSALPAPGLFEKACEQLQQYGSQSSARHRARPGASC